jgi:uncharacterized membrane protein YdbT with pleckstrin-like domain
MVMSDNKVIFGGSPTWRVNLPFFLARAVVAVLTIGAAWSAAAYGYAIAWSVAMVLVGLLGFSVLYRIVETMLVKIVADSERLTYRRGTFNRLTASIELYRVQTVECSTTLWQRLLGYGTLIVYSSDVTHPRWEIPGMVDVETKRLLLNRAAIALRDAKGIREVNMGKV